jgi:molybdopterin synthase sulfur carrier subunit
MHGLQVANGARYDQAHRSPGRSVGLFLRAHATAGSLVFVAKRVHCCELMRGRKINAPEHFKVQVRLFAGLAELAGEAEITIEVQAGSTVSDVVGKLWGATLPETERVQALVDVSRLAVDAEFVDESTVVQPGQEVALIPPVSGG